MKSYERVHKALYDRVRRQQPAIPAWDDLTEEQRVRLRRVNDEHVLFMEDLGEEIRKGAKA